MKKLKRDSLLCLFSLLVAELSFGQSPTVNGQFYGDGDHNIYEFWQEGSSNSKICVYFPVPGGDPNLYVALVAGRSMNDNVFAESNSTTDADYMISAGWGISDDGNVQERKANNLYSFFSASQKVRTTIIITFTQLIEILYV